MASRRARTPQGVRSFLSSTITNVGSCRDGRMDTFKVPPMTAVPAEISETHTNLTMKHLVISSRIPAAPGPCREITCVAQRKQRASALL